MDISSLNDIGTQIQALHTQGGAAAVCGVFADPMQAASNVISGAVPVVAVGTTVASKGHPAVLFGDGVYLQTHGYTVDMLIAAVMNAWDTVTALLV